MLPPDMTHDLRCPLGVLAAETLQKILRELVAARNVAIRQFFRRNNAPARSRNYPIRVSPHPRRFSSDNSPCKAKKDHNSVYLRPTVVVSEGFRNLSVALGRFRKARLIKPTFLARLNSRRLVRNCRVDSPKKIQNYYFAASRDANWRDFHEINFMLDISLISLVMIHWTVD